MKNINKYPFDFWSLVVSLLSKHVDSITIKTSDAVITIKRKEGQLTAMVYRTGELRAVLYHGCSSVKELVLAFESLGICISGLVRKLLVYRFKKARKPICIDLIPESKS